MCSKCPCKEALHHVEDSEHKQAFRHIMKKKTGSDFNRQLVIVVFTHKPYVCSCIICSCLICCTLGQIQCGHVKCLTCRGWQFTVVLFVEDGKLYILHLECHLENTCMYSVLPCHDCAAGYNHVCKLSLVSLLGKMPPVEQPSLMCGKRSQHVSCLLGLVFFNPPRVSASLFH